MKYSIIVAFMCVTLASFSAQADELSTNTNTCTGAAVDSTPAKRASALAQFVLNFGSPTVYQGESQRALAIVTIDGVSWVASATSSGKSPYILILSKKDEVSENNLQALSDVDVDGTVDQATPVNGTKPTQETLDLANEVYTKLLRKKCYTPTIELSITFD